jgi:hypothetical protein
VVCRVSPTITKAAPPATQPIPVFLQTMSAHVLPLQAILVFCPWTIAAVPPTIKPPPTIVRIFPVLLQCRCFAGGGSDGTVPESRAADGLRVTTRNPEAGGNSLGETKSAAEAGEPAPNIAITRSMAKKRWVIKFCSPKCWTTQLCLKRRPNSSCALSPCEAFSKRREASALQGPLTGFLAQAADAKMALQSPQHLESLGRAI